MAFQGARWTTLPASTQPWFRTCLQGRASEDLCGGIHILRRVTVVLCHSFAIISISMPSCPPHLAPSLKCHRPPWLSRMRQSSLCHTDYSYVQSCRSWSVLHPPHLSHSQDCQSFVAQNHLCCPSVSHWIYGLFPCSVLGDIPLGFPDKIWDA